MMHPPSQMKRHGMSPPLLTAAPGRKKPSRKTGLTSPVSLLIIPSALMQTVFPPGNINTVHSNRSKFSMTTTIISDLKVRLRGALLMPGDKDYDAARKVYNGMIDKRPAF